MPIQILEQSRIEEWTDYYLMAERINGHGGVMFPCDENGNFSIEFLHETDEIPARLENMLELFYGDTLGEVWLEACPQRERIPARAECYCGKEIWLGHGMSNKCDKCGRLYNGSGQELKQNIREWGEDTNEHFLHAWDFDLDYEPF